MILHGMPPAARSMPERGRALIGSLCKIVDESGGIHHFDEESPRTDQEPV
jgi:hypothetical protein